jgi:hypothetical protein
MVSFGAHLVGITAVNIVPPENFFKTEPFTEVTFLGPLLERTAIDIMIGGQDPAGRTKYAFASMRDIYDPLKVPVPKINTGFTATEVHGASGMDLMIRDFLSGNKSTPGALFGIDAAGGLMRESGMRPLSPLSKREVIHRPVPPRVISGIYGRRDSFSVRVRALVDRGGRVIRAESFTTTGYPGLDMLASKYVKGWMFESSDASPSEGEWVDVEVKLLTSPGGE